MQTVRQETWISLQHVSGESNIKIAVELSKIGLVAAPLKLCYLKGITHHVYLIC